MATTWRVTSADVDAGDRPEQEAVEVAGVARLLAAHDHHGGAQEADEQDADRGVVGERRCGADDVDAGDHRQGGDERADRRVVAEHEGDGDAGQHAVGEGVAEEAHAAQHDPRADQRRAHGREQHRPQRRAHELVVGERRDPPRPRVGEEASRRASRPSGQLGECARRRWRRRWSASDRRRSRRRSPSSPSESVCSSTTSTPSRSASVVGLVGGLQRLGEDRRHAGGLDLAGRAARARRGTPRRASTTGQHGAEDLEVVAVGEVAEGVVVGHQQAAIGGTRTGSRVSSASSSSISAVRTSSTHCSTVARVGAGGDEGVADRCGAASTTSVGSNHTCGSSPRSTCSTTRQHRSAVAGRRRRACRRAVPRARRRWRRRGPRRRASLAVAHRRLEGVGVAAGRDQRLDRRSCPRSRRGRRCRPRSTSWRRRPGVVGARRRRRATAAPSDQRGERRPPPDDK